MATRTNGFCSCAKEILECPFWENVRKELEQAGYEGGRMETSRVGFYKGNSPFAKAKAYLGLILFARGTANLIEKEYFNQLKNEAELLRKISLVSERPILIDASKSLVRAVALSAILKEEFDAHYIHLYREPVPVVYSAMKKNMSVKLEDREIVYSKKKLPSLAEATDNWRRGNNSNLLLSKIFGLNPAYICYESFTNDPKKAFQKVGTELGIGWEDGMLDLSQSGHHMVSGNLSRINAKQVNSPKEDWRNMASGERAYVREKTRNVLAKMEARAKRQELSP